MSHRSNRIRQQLPSFEEWKDMPDGHRDYYLYQALATAVDLQCKQEEFEKYVKREYASKWVETKFAIPILSILALSVIYALINLVVGEDAVGVVDSFSGD